LMWLVKKKRWSRKKINIHCATSC